MKNAIVAALLLNTLSTAAFAGGYDSSWYKTDHWSGEYPDGVSIVKAGVKVKGRRKMNKDSRPRVKCELPYLAVFQPWNEARTKISEVSFYTLAKIQNLVAKDDFNFVSAALSPETIAIKKGQIIEFLAYDQEGFFFVRINGKEYTADLSLFDHIPGHEGGEVSITQEVDQWLQVKCENGKHAWLLLADLKSVKGVVIDGNIKDYGTSLDLTPSEAEELAKQNP